MNGRNAILFQAPLQTEIEIRSIDTDEGVRGLGDESGQQRPANSRDFSVMPDDFGVAAHRKPFSREYGLETCSLHFGSANTVKMRIWQAFVQSADQVARQQIA